MLIRRLHEPYEEYEAFCVELDAFPSWFPKEDTKITRERIDQPFGDYYYEMNLEIKTNDWTTYAKSWDVVYKNDRVSGTIFHTISQEEFNKDWEVVHKVVYEGGDLYEEVIK